MAQLPAYLLLIGLGAALLPLPALAADQSQPMTGPVTIVSRMLTYDGRTEQIEATGDVRITGRGMTLLADSAVLHTSEDVAEASGNVSLMKDKDTLRGTRIKVSFKDGTGEIEQGEVFIKERNLRIRGERMYRLGPETYHLDRGTFTTCDAETPSWKFSARDLDVTLDEFATGTHALFYIKDVPVFYFPYLIFPAKRERQSGLLTPRIGNSGTKGATLNLAYYWAISPSQEATFNLDLLSKRGVGTGVEYRYIRRRGSEGKFNGFVIYDTKEQRFRGDIVQRHQEYSPDGSFMVKSDVKWISDKSFLRDFAEESGVYNESELESSASVSKQFRRQVLAAELRYVKDLREEVENSTILQKLPMLNLYSVRQRIGTLPLFIKTDGSFTNFARDKGVEGQRLELLPSISTYGKLLPGVDASAWAGYLGRFYNANGAEAGQGENGTAADGIFSGGATLSSTVARVFATGNPAMPKVRHVMIPELSYVYAQKTSQNDLPYFDYHDRVVHQNRIVYSLTNYVTGRFNKGDDTAEYRELLYLRLSQGYDFSGTRRDLLTLVDDKRPFTDIMLDARVTPVKNVSFTLDTRFSPYRGDFNTAVVGAQAGDDGGNKARVAYRYAHDEVDYLEGEMAISVLKPVFLTYTGRYSFDSNDFLESHYVLEYRHQCWSVAFSYRDRRDNQEFFVSFSLAGIGQVGKVRAL